MVKKHIHHFSRGVVIGFECLGLAACVLFVSWLFLIIRLSQGPMNVDFLTKNIERGLNNQQTGFEFNVGSTRLTWGGTTEPFEFEINQVQINRTDKTPVLSVEKIGIQLSKRYLVFGKFVPRVIKIYSPALRVIRGGDGHFLLNMSNAAAASELKTDNEAVGQNDFMGSLLAQMKDTGTFDLLAGLEQVAITDAALLYEDKILNVSWKSRNSNISFTRQRGGMLIDSLSNVDMDQDHKAYVRGSFYYSWHTLRPSGVVYFTGFNPSMVVQKSEQLKNYAGIDLSLKGSISFEMDRDFNLEEGRFVLGADHGKFNAFQFYHDPAPIKSLYAQGRFNVATKELQLEQLRVDMDGPKLAARGEIKKQSDGYLLQLAALLQNTPLDRLKNYWPEMLAVDARSWVTGHLSVGTATKAALDLSLLAPQGDFNNLKVQKVGGQIDFNDVKVDYFPPLMPVTRVNGKATYDEKSFNIETTGGLLGDMQVTKSKIHISDLDIQDDKTHSKIDIAVALNGPLKTALKVLDSEPLQYPRKLGIHRSEVGGDASVEVNFKFPLYDNLSVQEVAVASHAKLNNILLKNVISDFDLTGGPLDLSVDTGAMTVKGRGMLGGMPVDFHWLNNFSTGAEIASKVEAKLSLDAPALLKFGVPDYFKLGGIFPADVTYTVSKDHTATLALKGDITPLAFSIPIAGYEKTGSTHGALDLFLHFNKAGNLAQISTLDLNTEKDHLKGSVEFGVDGKSLRKASFSQFKLGDTDIVLDVANNGKDGYAVKITGKQFDASKILSGDDKANSDEEANKPVTPMTASMAVDRFMTGPDKSIGQVRMFMRRNGWGRLEQLDVDGSSGGKPISLHYLPVPHGHTLQFEADNAGAALSVLGITSGLRGGKVIVTGQPAPKGGPRDMRGVVVLTDFTAINIPTLGRLLNAMSLTGIVELLNGKGIAFKKMHANFQWIDKGEPESNKNVRLIRLKGGETSGASLGLTFEGDIDNWANILSLNGTIIPVSDLNKLVSIIPLVGDILTGGGKGVFAATYTVKGPKAEPTVTVNPLSVLAPGIFRKLFFEK
ncbi:MAG: hypothetical protein HY052_02310 [Proteobacteria bacterium]|nr:hypothetical protein [Pseudomonadota bacterium]